MPKDRETSNHPCHFLSLPSARRFWCRHCMSVFEDAITRWRHSRTCRYGVVSNFMRRRELEAKALQNTTKPNPIEARLEQSVEAPVIPPVDVNNSDGEGSSNQSSGQDGKAASSFRCFICQSQFSTLEEMRHHVKYPCNLKKTVTEENQAAMTVYIDEFTDRSRPWDPVPQPQQEEVYTSEFVHSMETDPKEHSALTVDGKQEESMVAAPSMKQQDNITPTNIYVNEQGETVIEVENLDLNSEGGELSLAHLLAQLSQQGIVFDKSKSGHMQPRQEMTVSDPTSGKVYTTAPSLNYPSIAQGVKSEEDEGQPTAEDAANTLAQLAGFRGFRNSQELYEGTQTIANQPKTDQHIIGAAQGYEYPSSLTLPIVTTSENRVNVNVESSQPELKVNYEYEYYPSSQTQSTSTERHIALQPIIQSGTQGFNNVKIEEEIVQHLPVHFYEDRSSSHGMAYITTTQGAQPHDADSMQNLETETIDVDGQRVIIDNGTGPVIIQQYGVGNSDSASEQFVDFPVQLPAVTTEAQTSDPTPRELFHHEQHSSQPLHSMESSEEILYTTDGNSGEPAGLSISNAQIISQPIENNSSDNVEAPSQSEQIVKIPEFPSSEDKESENNNEEFTIQTVSLQEIVEAETSNSITFVDKSRVLSVQNNCSPDSQVVHSIQDNHLPEVALDNVTSALSIIQDVNAPASLYSTAQSNLALASKFVISESQSSFEQSPSSSSARQAMPLFVVSSSGLQLVATDQKNVVSEAQAVPPDL